jgi:hypothetical protein
MMNNKIINKYEIFTCNPVTKFITPLYAWAMTLHDSLRVCYRDVTFWLIAN